MYTNLHQWYLAVGDSVETTEKYEDTILKFYKALKEPKPEKKVKQPMLNEFYKKEPFSKYVGKFIISKLKIALIIGIVAIIGIWLLKVCTADVAFVEAAKNMSNLIFAAIFGIISIILIDAIGVVLSFLNYKSIIKKLQTYETELKDIMISLPSSYRNSEKMKHIMNTYYAQKGISPEIAFGVCDDLYYQYKQRPFEGVMFDLPFRNDFVTSEDIIQNEQPVEKTAEEKTLENPNLPEDIKSKTFKGSEDAEKDLNNMIGLASVKDQIEKLENRIKFYGSNNNGNHMQFLGSAGTGKTTVARIVTKILYDLGYIKKNQYVEISGDYLKAGDTARADAIMEYSMGGVLFIDEAYLLYDKLGFSNEAIGVLLKAMEDHRGDFVVILAGYEEQMTRLIASNEGFSSRIKHTIYFPDYTEDECLAIFKYFIKNYHGKTYQLHANAVPLLLEAFTLEKQAKSFGNARTVRNAVDAIMDNYADRNIKAKTDTRIIEAEDVQKYIDSRKVFLQHEIKNSSAANNVDESIIRLSELKSKVKDGSENAIQDLANLIGLDSFCNELAAIKNQKEFYGKTEPQKILLIGGQGSGKSSLARILTGYLYENGYIQENKYLDISADFLKGSYVGHTSKRANAIINYATGGVLFIKNINMVANSEDSFAPEVLAAIDEALSSNLTIIIGDSDSQYIRGISNMFNVVYQIPAYNGEQLTQIFVQKAQEDNFTVSQEALDKAASILVNKTNVRDAINLYNNAKKKHITNFTEETKYVLVEQDIEKPVLKLKIGFNTAG